jgi:hypothetical protein
MQDFGGKSIRKESLGRPRCRWVDNIKMDLREIGWGGMEWIDLAQNRDQWTVLVKMVMNFQVPEYFGKFLSNCITAGFSRRAKPHAVSLVR